MEYSIVNGRVQTRSLEYHIIDHCNLRCDQCCSFSPLLKSWTVEPAQFEKDLILISKCMQPTFLKIVGGEPLLHPQLTELLKIANRIKLAPQLSITTNGHLLHKLSDEAWSYLQMLTVSIYPEPELSRETLKWIRQKAAEHSVSVSWKTQDKFVNLNRDTKSTEAEAKETFNNCWIHDRCHSVKAGRFYTCTRPQYIQKFADNPAKFLEDGIELAAFDENTLPAKIKNYLESTEPLKSCYMCRGGQAELGPHRQLSPQEIKQERTRLKEICNQI